MCIFPQDKTLKCFIAVFVKSKTPVFLSNGYAKHVFQYLTSDLIKLGS